MSAKKDTAQTKKDWGSPEHSPDIEVPLAMHNPGNQQAKKETNRAGDVESGRREDEALPPQTIPSRRPAPAPSSLSSGTAMEPERTFPGAVAVDNPLSSASASQPSTEPPSSTQAVADPEPFLAQAEVVEDTPPPIPLYAAQPMSSLSGSPPSTQSDREKRRLYWIIAILVVLVIVAVAAAVAAVVSTRNNGGGSTPSSPFVEGSNPSPTEPASLPTSPPPPTESASSPTDPPPPTEPASSPTNPPPPTEPPSSPTSPPPPTETPPSPTSPPPPPPTEPTVELEACDASSDCLNGACALDSYAPSVGTRKKVCCPSGTTEYLSSPDSDYFCTTIIPNGERCPITADGNRLCESGICLDDGKCAAEGKDNGSSCIENGDCQSLICLQLNRTCSVNKIPEASSCAVNGDCLNGVCAMDSYAPSTGSRKKVCCPSRGTEYLSSPDSDYFCTSNIPNGERCPITADGNRLCQSGICLDDGRCAAEGKANGLSCIENGDCQSLICLQLNMTCSASKIPEASSCAVNGDCLNGVCGLDSYAPSTGARKKVCCPSRDTEYLSSPDSDYFCTSNIPNGERCPISLDGNRLCQSGLCSEAGICA